jgi:predicted RNase H-like HicB family nuclease
VGESEGQKKIAAALGASCRDAARISKEEKQRSNFARRKIFVVVMTTLVLPFIFFSSNWASVILLKASMRNLTSRSLQEGRMEQGRLAFTAVYLKSNHGYIGFIEELPGVNSHGRTLDEARETLQKLAAVVFDEERREAEELIAGKDVVRENFIVPIPRVSA